MILIRLPDDGDRCCKKNGTGVTGSAIQQFSCPFAGIIFYFNHVPAPGEIPLADEDKSSTILNRFSMKQIIVLPDIGQSNPAGALSTLSDEYKGQ
jgi:hypothetical protein